MGTRSTLRLHTGNRMPAFGLGTSELTERTADTVVVSNYSMEQIKALVAATGETPVVGQVVEPVRLQPGNAGGVPRTEQRHPGVQPVDARDASRRSRARIHRRAVRQDAALPCCDGACRNCSPVCKYCLHSLKNPALRRPGSLFLVARFLLNQVSKTGHAGQSARREMVR